MRVQREMEERTVCPGLNQLVKQELEVPETSLCMEDGRFSGMSQDDSGKLQKVPKEKKQGQGIRNHIRNYINSKRCVLS